VNHLVTKLRQGQGLSETDDMALAGIISTQLVDQQFLSGFKSSTPLNDSDDIKVVIGQGASTEERPCP
jgi:asparagine synthase (glutamine-hydrolysing)